MSFISKLSFNDVPQNIPDDPPNETQSNRKSSISRNDILQEIWRERAHFNFLRVETRQFLSIDFRSFFYTSITENWISSERGSVNCYTLQTQNTNTIRFFFWIYFSCKNNVPDTHSWDIVGSPTVSTRPNSWDKLIFALLLMLYRLWMLGVSCSCTVLSVVCIIYCGVCTTYAAAVALIVVIHAVVSVVAVVGDFVILLVVSAELNATIARSTIQTLPMLV